jgi:hypothetical protein
VALPQDFFLRKANEATLITLRKNGPSRTGEERIEVVNVR